MSVRWFNRQRIKVMNVDEAMREHVRHYRRLVEGGVPKMDAITRTAEAFNVSEDTVQAAVYRYRDL